MPRLPRLMGCSLTLAMVMLSCGAPNALAQTAQSRMAKMHRLDGKLVEVQITAIKPDWKFTVRDNAGKSTQVAAADFAHWGKLHEHTGPTVLLTDGSQIAGDILRFGRKSLSVGIDYNNFSQRSIWEPAEIPLLRVRGVVFQQPGDLAQRDELLNWMSGATAKTDRLRLTNGDELSGSALRVGAPAPQEDAPADGDSPAQGQGGGQGGERDNGDDSAPQADEELEPAQVFWFKMNGREMAAPLSHVRAVALNPALSRAARKQSQCVVLGFRDGSRVFAKNLELDGRIAKVTTLGGVVLSTSSSRLLKQLSQIQAFGGEQADYLSDLAPIGYRHVPFLTMSWPDFGADANVRGGRMRNNGAPHAKGLAMHSTSRLAYVLPDEYRRFQAELAIDDLANGNGSVVFRVYVDNGNGRFASLYASPIIRGGQPPLPISLDIQGAKRLALIVDFADRGDSGDHANWLNARLVRSAAR